MGQRGKKTCPNCKKVIGARTQLCFCGYHYLSGKVRNDLLEKKKEAAQKERTYTELTQGRKRCPGCNKIVGGRLRVCYCGFDFVARKREVDELNTKEKEKKKRTKAAAPKEKISPLTQDILDNLTPHKASPKLNKEQHAQRIIGLGNHRAGILLLQHRIHKCWSHVDWDLVEKGLVC